MGPIIFTEKIRNPQTSIRKLPRQAPRHAEGHKGPFVTSGTLFAWAKLVKQENWSSACSVRPKPITSNICKRRCQALYLSRATPSTLNHRHKHKHRVRGGAKPAMITYKATIPDEGSSPRSCGYYQGVSLRAKKSYHALIVPYKNPKRGFSTP